MIRIELPEARGYLARAVLTQPRGFVYNPGGFTNTDACTYIPSTERPITGCFVGVALGLAGVDVERLAEVDASAVLFASGTWNREGLVSLSDDVTGYFQSAQRAQDGGSSWDEAYADAETYITRILDVRSRG